MLIVKERDMTTDASRRVCFTVFVPDSTRKMWHVFTRCFWFTVNADGSPPSLCVVHRLITTRTCSNIVIRASKYHKLARFLFVDALGRSVYIHLDTFSQILGNESAAYSLALKMYHRSLLSEHDQGFEHTRCSVLNFVPEPIYYICKWALIHCPYSISFLCFLSGWCTFLWVVNRNGNRLHRRRRQ